MSAPQPIEVLPPQEPAPPLDRRLAAKLDAAPVTVHGTWDAARTWIARATAAEEVKLYCQVMLGFELLALRESHGETRGRRPSGGNKSHDETFFERAHRETNLSRPTVFRLTAMAEAAIPRLRKLPTLRDFDPTATGVALLPEPQREVLSSAVRKLTDGLTQADFLVELGIAKAPQGSGATGGYHPRQGPEPTVEEQAEQQRKMAKDEFRRVCHLLGAEPTRFTLLDDLDIQAQIAALDCAARARRQWLAQPKGRRDPGLVTRVFDDFIAGTPVG